MDRILWALAAIVGIALGLWAMYGAFVLETSPFLRNVAFAVGVLVFGVSGTIAATIAERD